MKRSPAANVLIALLSTLLVAGGSTFFYVAQGHVSDGAPPLVIRAFLAVALDLLALLLLAGTVAVAVLLVSDVVDGTVAARQRRRASAPARS